VILAAILVASPIKVVAKLSPRLKTFFRLASAISSLLPDSGAPRAGLAAHQEDAEFLDQLLLELSASG
jgi:hypothetical protein